MEEVSSESISESPESASPPTSSETEEGEDHPSEDEEDHSEEHSDLSGLTKVQLLKLLKDKIHHEAVLKLDKLAHEIKAAFDDLVAKDTELALEKFKAEGGAEDDFEYRIHEEEKEFNKVFNDFRYQLNTLRKEAERQKEKNLFVKNELLNKLRDVS